MALGETAQLVVDLRLNDQLSGGVTRAEAQLAGLNRTATSGVGATGMLGGAFGRLSGAAEGVGGALSHAGNQLKGLVTGPAGMLGAVGGAYALVAGFKSAVDSATGFQAAMEMIATQAGGTQAEVDAMTKGILAMASSVGTAPDQLAAGLYHIESVGIRGAKALDLLKIAAEGAKVGNADLESVTNAMVASVTSGIKGVSDMGSAMGTLNAIVGAGNMRMQDLADAFGTGILSTAATFGVSIQSVGTAIADMTAQNIPAVDAATRLRMSMSLLGAPTAQAAKELKGIGISQLDLGDAMRSPGGIISAITLLRDGMQKSGLIGADGKANTEGANLLSRAFGGGRSSGAIMQLINDFSKLGGIQKQITDGAGNFDAAWQKTTQDAQFAFEKFQAAVGVVAIRLGDALLPVLTQVASAAGDWLGDPSNQQSLVGGLNAAIDAGRTFGAAIKDFVIPPLKAIADVIGAIPGPIKEAAVALFALNKAGGWLFGTSPLSLGRSVIGGLLGSTAGRIPGVGGVVSGALGVPHVWVDNMPAGGLGVGGGLGGAAEGAAAAAGGGAVIGAATLGAGIAAILGAYYLPQILAANNAPAQPSVVQSGAMAGTVLPATGYMSVDALSQGNPALAAAIAANTHTIATNTADTARAATRDNYAQDAALAHQAATARATRDTYAVEAARASSERTAAAAQTRQLTLIAANETKSVSDHARSLAATQAGAAASAAVARSSAATAASAAQFKSRLDRINADDNANARRTIDAVHDSRSPVTVNTSVNVNTAVSVSDVARTTYHSRLSGGSTVVWGNRPQGAAGVS